MLKTDVTWGKIASLYCVAGGLAIDCVHQGHPEYLYGIVETMGFVIERDAATWIAQQGGWVRIKLGSQFSIEKNPVRWRYGEKFPAEKRK